MNELIFLVEEADEGGYIAKALGENIITQSETLAELKEMVKDAVRCHFDVSQLPKWFGFILWKKKFLLYEDTAGPVSGADLIKLLKRYGFEQTRQSGSHIRLTAQKEGEYHITIPNHSPLKIGTLSAILSDIAAHLKMSKDDLMHDLFG